MNPSSTWRADALPRVARALAFALAGLAGCRGTPEVRPPERSIDPVAIADIGADVFDGDADPRHAFRLPHGVIGIFDVTYKTWTGFRPLTLDLYLPPSGRDAPRRPFIVYVHDGGWIAGTRRTTGPFRNWPQVLAAIAARGYVVASIDYRLAGEAPFPAAVHDVEAALRYLRAHAATYQVDEHRGLLWGASAGGQLASLVAVTSGRVQAAISWYGVADFRAVGDGPARAFLACETDACSYAGNVHAASPVAHVDPGDPPLLLVHGIEDTTIPFEHSQALHDALQANGIAAELVLLPGVGHHFIGPDLATTRAANRLALARTLAFVDQTIGHRR